MSTTAKIDFEPGLFDEGQPEAATDLPTIQPKRRASRAPFIVAGGLLLVLAAAFFALNGTSKPKTVPAMLAEGPQTAAGAFLQPALGQGSQIVRNTPVGDSEGFCSDMRRCAPPVRPTSQPKRSPSWPLRYLLERPNATG